jgi:hypothetical protein
VRGRKRAEGEVRGVVERGRGEEREGKGERGRAREGW